MFARSCLDLSRCLTSLVSTHRYAMTMSMRLERTEIDNYRRCAEAQSFLRRFPEVSCTTAKTCVFGFDTNPSPCPAVINHAKCSTKPNRNSKSHTQESMEGLF